MVKELFSRKHMSSTVQQKHLSTMKDGHLGSAEYRGFSSAAAVEQEYLACYLAGRPEL